MPALAGAASGTRANFNDESESPDCAGSIL